MKIKKIGRGGFVKFHDKKQNIFSVCSIFFSSNISQQLLHRTFLSRINSFGPDFFLEWQAQIHRPFPEVILDSK